MVVPRQMKKPESYASGSLTHRHWRKGRPLPVGLKLADRVRIAKNKTATAISPLGDSLASLRNDVTESNMSRRNMISSQAAAQSEGAAASQASSSTGRSSADLEKHYSLLVKRRETALKPSNKSKGAAWWAYFKVKLLRDPVTDAATNVLLKCTLCEQQLSSSNPTRIAETHLVKGGCLEIKTSAATAATVSDRLIKQPAEPVQHQGEVNASSGAHVHVQKAQI
ncbi:hypothetical protein WJX77_000130 [Trebouxia sp. C0004]